MLRTYRDQGIVLRAYKLGEADRILVLLGKDSGLIRAVAKGVRRPTSRFGGRLDAFNLVDLQLYRGRNLDTITQAELLSGYARPLGEDYQGFTAAKVLAETTQKLTESMESSGQDYFALLHGALAALAGRREAPQLITTSYLLRVMKEAGWPPALEECAICGAAGPHQRFDPNSGGSVCPDCAPAESLDLPLPVLQLLQALILGDWEKARQIPAEYWDEAGAVGAQWAQYHLEQRLRSLPFLQPVKEIR